MHPYEITIYWAIGLVSVLMLTIIGLFGWSLARSQRYLHAQTRESYRAELARQEERNQLAMDLHDEVGPLLTRAMSLVTVLRRRTEGQDEYLDNLQICLQQVTACTRRMAEDLLPTSVFEKGLPGALQELFLEFRAFHGVETEAVLSLRAVPPAPVAMHVYRMVQEMLSNAVKHSGGKRMILHLRQEGEAVVLQFQDNGKGFEPRQVQDKGLGLRSLQLRAVLLGGELRCLSNANGTLYSLQIPLKKWIQPVL